MTSTVKLKKLADSFRLAGFGPSEELSSSVNSNLITRVPGVVFLRLYTANGMN